MAKFFDLSKDRRGSGVVQDRPGGAISAARMRVSINLDPVELLTVRPADTEHMTLHVCLPSRTATPAIATRTLVKAQQVISEAGVGHVSLKLAGYLEAGDRIAEAGLSAQPKARRSYKM